MFIPPGRGEGPHTCGAVPRCFAARSLLQTPVPASKRGTAASWTRWCTHSRPHAQDFRPRATLLQVLRVHKYGASTFKSILRRLTAGRTGVSLQQRVMLPSISVILACSCFKGEFMSRSLTTAFQLFPNENNLSARAPPYKLPSVDCLLAVALTSSRGFVI